MQTAEYILPFSTCNYLNINPNVRPWGLGSLGGQPKNAKNKNILQRYIDNPDTVPEGDNAESLNSFRNRWSDVLRAALISANPEYPTVIVGHTSNVTATEELYVENSEKRPETHDIIVPGGILAVYFDESKGGIELQPVLGGVEHEQEAEAS
jgi:broad specificity phosphatase PhoE